MRNLLKEFLVVTYVSTVSLLESFNPVSTARNQLNTYGEMRNAQKLWLESLKESDRLEGQSVDGNIILKGF